MGASPFSAGLLVKTPVKEMRLLCYHASKFTQKILHYQKATQRVKSRRSSISQSRSLSASEVIQTSIKLGHNLLAENTFQVKLFMAHCLYNGILVLNGL
jgi:hypothetical protein